MTSNFPRTFCACLVLALAVAAAARVEAQAVGGARPQAPAPTQGPTAAATESRTNADEDFELNIVERRINEENFEAATEVEVGGDAESGFNVRVGVGVGAESIDVLLRNVRGRVRFRATLEPLLRRFNLRRADEATSPSP